MIYRLAGQPATLTLDFKVDGEFVVPDESSVFITIRGSDGSVFSGYESTAISSINTSTYEVEIADTVQSISEEFEPRWVQVDYKYAGKSYKLSLTYKVHSFIPITVTEKDVRNLFGAEYRELPDEDIDILAQYGYLSEVYGEPFQTAFSNTAAAHRANQALALGTALELCSQMRSRLLNRERNDTSEFERFTLDFDQLEMDLRSKFSTQIRMAIELAGGTFSSGEALYESFIVTSPTDPFTGS